mgnify:CR=1 FL=1
MYGLPNQTITDIKNDLAKVRQLPIEHISYYSLILEDHTVLKNLNYQPLDEEVESKITQLIEESLEQIGSINMKLVILRKLDMSHFIT